MVRGRQLLRKAAKASGKTYEELGEIVGNRGFRTARHFMEGRRSLPIELAVEIAYALPVPLRELLTVKQRRMLQRAVKKLRPPAPGARA